LNLKKGGVIVKSCVRQHQEAIRLFSVPYVIDQGIHLQAILAYNADSACYENAHHLPLSRTRAACRLIPWKRRYNVMFKPASLRNASCPA